MRTLFLTGATGFLGGHFIPLTLKRNWRIRGLTRQKKTGKPGLEWVQGDLGQGGRWERRLKGCDTLVHLATHPLADCQNDPEMGCAIMVEGFQRLLEASEKAGVRRLVVASTAEVYGSRTGAPVHEKDPLTPLSMYGFFKACNEIMARNFAARTGASLCILRFFNLYGCPAEGEIPWTVIRIFLERILKDQKIVVHGSARNSRDFLHIRDAAKALLLALTKPGVEGVFNICSGRETTLLKLARKLARLSGHALKYEIHAKEGRFRRLIGSGMQARRVLEFEPKVALEEGLEEVINHLVGES